jgi:hypothetical protein
MTRVRSEMARRRHAFPLGLVFIGALAVGVGLRTSPERTWLNLLVSGFYILSLAVSAMFFIASQLVSGARWSAPMRRVPEAFMLLLPLAAVLMLGVFMGRGFLYPWALEGAFEHDPGAAARAWYLRTPFVFCRLVVALAAWAWFALAFRKASLDQDDHPSESLVHHRRLLRYAAAFLLLFPLLFTVAAYDWVLSLEARWFSTMFAVYAFAGMFVQGLAAVTVAVVVLRQQGRFDSAVETSRLHDLGKLLFAFSTFWAYIWLCQYLLVWYGNVPEEVTYYVRRTNGAWLVLFALDVVLNWLVPFVALMSARAKQNPGTLGAVAVLLLVGRWLDLYVMIVPSRLPVPAFGPLDVLVPVAGASMAYLLVQSGLSQAPLVPLNDPIVAADRLQGAHGHG